MNRSHPNKNDLKNRMTKKNLKELKIITCTDKVYSSLVFTLRSREW